MAHLPPFKSSSFNLLVIQVQPRHRHKLRKPWSHPICQSWRTKRSQKGCFPCASGDGCFETVGVANIHHKHSTVASSLTNALGLRYQAHDLGSRSDQKYAKRVDLSLKNRNSLQNWRHFHPIPTKRPGWSTRQSQAPYNFASLPPPTNMAPPQGKMVTKGLTAYPKVQMLHHANLFLKNPFGIIPNSPI